jgi:hypothetical protein
MQLRRGLPLCLFRNGCRDDVVAFAQAHVQVDNVRVWFADFSVGVVVTLHMCL